MQERVDNKKTPYNTVKLLTSTIKAGADEEGLRYCFRVVSPEKIYLLQVVTFLFMFQSLCTLGYPMHTLIGRQSCCCLVQEAYSSLNFEPINQVCNVLGTS